MGDGGRILPITVADTRYRIRRYAARRRPPHNNRMYSDTAAWRSVRRRVLVVVVMAVIAGPLLDAQWFTYPSPRAPRTATGEVDLSAATPRLTNGKPDLSGVWMTAEPACVVRGVLPLAELVKL